MVKIKSINNPTKENLFKTLVVFPEETLHREEALDKSEYLCVEASIPPIRKVFGRNRFENLSLTFYNDETYILRNAFEAWFKGKKSKQRVSIEQLNRKGETIKEYDFLYAHPIFLGGFVNHLDGEKNLQTFEVIFEYSKWIATINPEK